MAKVLVCGLNPAWQQVFVLRSLRVGAVNRAGEFFAMASGKGLNVAKVLARAGHQVSLLQVLAGENGRRVLDECARLGVRSLHAWADGETRVCTTLIDGEEKSTEIIAPFSALPGDRISAALLERVRPEEKFDALLICGTMPSGLEEGLYGSLAARVPAPLLIWDSVAEISVDTLPRLTWLKVNAEEYRGLAPLLGRLREKSPGASSPSLLITEGAAPATVHLAKTAETWKSAVPRLAGVLNPIGAGDTATAMLADGLLRGLDARAAVACALAASSASCLHPLPAEWDSGDAARLEREVQWTRA
jgi:fructose-1-phosphate kinase PfkB-like protein